MLIIPPAIVCCTQNGGKIEVQGQIVKIRGTIVSRLKIPVYGGKCHQLSDGRIYIKNPKNIKGDVIIDWLLGEVIFLEKDVN